MNMNLDEITPSMLVIPERVIKSMVHNQPESEIVSFIYRFSDDRYNLDILYTLLYRFCSYIHKSPYKMLQAIAEKHSKDSEYDYFSTDITGDVSENLDSLLNKLSYSYLKFLQYEDEEADELEFCYLLIRVINVVQYVANEKDTEGESMNPIDTNRLEVVECKGEADTEEESSESQTITISAEKLNTLVELLGDMCDQVGVPFPESVKSLASNK